VVFRQWVARSLICHLNARKRRVKAGGTGSFGPGKAVSRRLHSRQRLATAGGGTCHRDKGLLAMAAAAA
jgi:hypothetical protein